MRQLAGRFLRGLHALVGGRVGWVVEAGDVWATISGLDDRARRQAVKQVLTDLGFIGPADGGILLLSVGKDDVPGA